MLMSTHNRNDDVDGFSGFNIDSRLDVGSSAHDRADFPAGRQPVYAKTLGSVETVNHKTPVAGDAEAVKVPPTGLFAVDDEEWHDHNRVGKSDAAALRNQPASDRPRRHEQQRPRFQVLRDI